MADLNEKITDASEEVEETSSKDKKAKEKKQKEKKPNVFKRFAYYIRDCVSELKKVTWLSKKETAKSSLVVLTVVIALSVVIGILDTAFEFGILGLHQFYNNFLAL